MSFEYIPFRRQINYYETDKMGVVHHSNYIRWFEEARLDFMRQGGLEFSEMENAGIMMPVTEISCQYKIPVHFGESVVIKAEMLAFNGVRATIGYEVYSENGSLVAVGKSGHCFVSEAKRYPMNLKERYPEYYRCCAALLPSPEAD
jgi:acyl-CoA thioester hydrolase